MGKILDWFFDAFFRAWRAIELWWGPGTPANPGRGWNLEVLRNLGKTVLVVIAFLLVRRLVVQPVSRLFKHPRTRYNARKWGNAVLSVATIAGVIAIWITTSDADWFGYFSIFSAGLAIALKDPILNFFGWVFISVREPFDVKDRVEIFFDERRVKGDVVDIRLSMFSLLEVGNWVDAEQSTGRILHIPNGVVFTNVIANYTQGFKHIWNEIPVTVTFESNWEKAHKILTRIVSEQSREAVRDAQAQVHDTSTRFMVYYTRFTPIVWVKVADIGVTLTMRYLCDTRRRRSSEHAIWSATLKEFGRHADIDFAYPTTRFYDNRGEGKKPLRKPGAVVHSETPETPIEETGDFEAQDLDLQSLADISAIVTSEHSEEETGIFDLARLRKLTAEFESRKGKGDEPTRKSESDE